MNGKYLVKAIEHSLWAYDQDVLLAWCKHSIDKINYFEYGQKIDDRCNQRWYITCPKTVLKWYTIFNHYITNVSYTNSQSIRKQSWQCYWIATQIWNKHLFYIVRTISRKMSTETVQDCMMNTHLPSLRLKTKRRVKLTLF